MLQVLGRGTSINVRKVLWTCAEIGVEPEHIEWGSPALPLSSPEFLALNPGGLVPVLRDGALVLRESNTICRYLAARHGRTDLLPTSPAERAQVEQWMDWQATELNTAWRYAFMGLVRQHPDFQAPEQIARSVQAWNRQMGLLDQALAGREPYVLGADFTLADVVLGLSTHRWLSTPMERPDLPAVSAWTARLQQRPGFLRFGCNGGP
jgi:glutathione S-transferase